MAAHRCLVITFRLTSGGSNDVRSCSTPEVLEPSVGETNKLAKNIEIEDETDKLAKDFEPKEGTDKLDKKGTEVSRGASKKEEE